nr:MAG TPA: hypothetical protein [Caudoviricetes sp.]DAZ53733.1 MAG TPA: hypothetical protein [Caudoviricetes sp.]
MKKSRPTAATVKRQEGTIAIIVQTRTVLL